VTDTRLRHIAPGELISIIPETDWEDRILDVIRGLHSEKRDCILYYDWRAGVVRIIPVDNVRSIKLR
jgi:hypothetical protein